MARFLNPIICFPLCGLLCLTWVTFKLNSGNSGMHFLGSSPKPACLWEILPSRSGCVSALGCGRGLPALAHLPSHECARALLGYHCSSSQWVSSSGEWNDAALYTEPLLGKGTWTKILRQGSLNTRGQSELPHVPCFGTSCLQTVSNSLSVWILSKDSNDHYLNILIYIYIFIWNNYFGSRWQNSKCFQSMIILE